jgi:tetratricopeptide (TPR) repeat protein
MQTQAGRPLGLPHQTYAWIRTHLPGNALVLTPDGPVVYLYAERHASYGFSTVDANHMLYHASLAGFTHLLAVEEGLLLSMQMPNARPEQAMTVWQRVQEWARKRPDLFEPVYANDRERSVLYRLRRDPRFEAAYGLYLQAKASPRRSARARDLLRRALQIDPSLAEASDALGEADDLSGRPASAALAYDRALASRPDYAPALTHRAQLRMRQGRRPGACQDFQAARAAIDRTGEFVFLLPAIEQEEAPCRADPAGWQTGG